MTLKILSLDIETAPAVVYSWGLWDQNIGLNQIVEQVRVLCVAAKFLDEKKIHFFSEWDDGRKGMLEGIHELMSQADVIMTWNGDRFDIPHLHREFLEAGMAPPAPSKTIDLMKVVKREFKFMSNKLENIANRLSLEGKIKHSGFDLWVGVMKGDPDSQKQMKVYNKRDVTLLEDVHDIIHPWIRLYPPVPLHEDGDENSCPKCGSDVRTRRGFYYTQVSRFLKYQCGDCKSYYRVSTADARIKTRAV
jgi:hypothetical protein